MQAINKNTLKARWDRITNLDLNNLPLLTASEQTKRSWAKEIESCHKVPEVYKDFYEDLQKDGSSFPYTVITPTFTGFIHRENEKLICSQENKIFVLENTNDQLITSCYAIEEINYIEVVTILLKAWIRISGLVDNGVLSSSTLRFNSVTEYMFDPFVDKIRAPASNPSSNGSSSELGKFDYLSEINFKFMNYARNSILPGEQIVDHVFQPEIRSTIFALFGKQIYRTLYSSHIGILTDKELIMIEETGSGGMSKGKLYGGTWYYIPLGKICSVSLKETDHDLSKLSITLSAGEHIDTHFSNSKKPDVERLVKKLNGLISGGKVSQD